MYEKILDIAEELFMTQGYRKTSTRQIAEKLNITQPNLYHHFRKKEDIYFAVMERLCQKVKEHLEKILSYDEKSFDERLMNCALYLKESHPIDLNSMMHDIHYNLTPKMSAAIYQLWRSGYQMPIQLFFEKNRERFSSFDDMSLVTSQFFVVLSSQLTKKDNTELKKVIEMFLYGVLNE